MAPGGARRGSAAAAAGKPSRGTRGASRLPARSLSASRAPAALSAGARAGGACCALPRGPKLLGVPKALAGSGRAHAFCPGPAAVLSSGSAFVPALQIPKLSEMGAPLRGHPRPTSAPPSSCAAPPRFTGHIPREPQGPRLTVQQEVKGARRCGNHFELPLRRPAWRSHSGSGREPTAWGGAPGSGGLQGSKAVLEPWDLRGRRCPMPLRPESAQPSCRPSSPTFGPLPLGWGGIGPSSL